MKSNLTKWGNSLAVRIPKAFAEQLQITDESKVEITCSKDKIVIQKSKYTLDDLLKDITPENLHCETDTGTILGKEIW